MDSLFPHSHGHFTRSVLSPCPCLPVPVSVWDVFVLYLFVGRRRETQVGTGAECPASRQTKSLQKLFLEQGQLDEFLELLMLHLFPRQAP